ncbi:alpha/beta fold hydrolase [Terricaulis sp.]|uniref:alpha/beta fold hydrolase n=1 Tax=Terricaulis sp. TaxID=2768686 RepID=UPI0037846114
MSESEDVAQKMFPPPRRRTAPRVAEPLRAVDVTAVAGPQGRIAAWRLGEGPAVLLVHGWEDDNALWTRTIDALVARGHAVIAFDNPAHGLSDGERGHAPEVADAIFAVAETLGPIKAIVAHSVGCWGAALAINEGLAAARFVLIAPPSGEAEERWRRAAARMGMSEDELMAAVGRMKERLAAQGRDTLDATAPKLKLPMLFVHSRIDDRCPFDGAEAMAAACKDARFYPLEEADHRGTAQDAEAIAAIIYFLES